MKRRTQKGCCFKPKSPLDWPSSFSISIKDTSLSRSPQFESQSVVSGESVKFLLWPTCKPTSVSPKSPLDPVPIDKSKKLFSCSVMSWSFKTQEKHNIPTINCVHRVNRTTINLNQTKKIVYQLHSHGVPKNNQQHFTVNLGDNFKSIYLVFPARFFTTSKQFKL